MEIPPYTILMLIFSAAILIYAAIMAITKDIRMIPFHFRYRAKMKNRKLYMTQFAKILALVGLVPGLTGIVAIFSGVGAGIVFVVGMVVTLWAGTKIIQKAI